MWNCYLEIFRVIHFFVCTLSLTVIWKFDSPHVKTELHSHINFYRQLVQWWRIRKFFLAPNTHGSPAGNWHRPAAGRHWATAALSSLAASEDNSESLLCHCKVRLQSSAALFVLPERYVSKSIYSREIKNTHLPGPDNGCCCWCVKQWKWVK